MYACRKTDISLILLVLHEATFRTIFKYCKTGNPYGRYGRYGPYGPYGPFGSYGP